MPNKQTPPAATEKKTTQYGIKLQRDRRMLGAVRVWGRVHWGRLHRGLRAKCWLAEGGVR